MHRLTTLTLALSLTPALALASPASSGRTSERGQQEKVEARGTDSAGRKAADKAKAGVPTPTRVAPESRKKPAKPRPPQAVAPADTDDDDTDLDDIIWDTEFLVLRHRLDGGGPIRSTTYPLPAWQTGPST